MTAEELRALQAPLKDRYRNQPNLAVTTMRASGRLDPVSLSCQVEAPAGPIVAGLHPMAGGDGTWACSGDMLLQALVACTGVTLCAVATALGIDLRGGEVVAEGDIDFRGTLGIDRETPVGLTQIRLQITLDTDANETQLAKLLELTERYCVVMQTLTKPPKLTKTLKSRH